ncbi:MULTISPECIES: hypothetical protein [unclassified Bartonella]|uniref:hypothetical protein n=2 Tax=unclassified Bartonella TaxID=2645622 RepID=UPI0035CEC86B
MFTDKQLRALFGIIIFIFLCFLGIKKNPYFIQGILIFASFGLIIITNIFVILCNSHIPFELQNNPKYKDDDTTGWKILTRDLQQYLHRLLKLISLALVVLIFPNSYTVFWYLDIVIWYFFLVYSFFLMLHTRSLINMSIYAIQSSIKKKES